MKVKSRLAVVVAVAAALFLMIPGAASAAFLQGWFIDVDGPGGSAPVQVNQFLDIVGQAYVQNNLGLGTFTEFGAFRSQTADTFVALPGTAELTGTLTATGTVTLGGVIGFTGGTVNIYSDAANNFGTGAGTFGADDGTLIGSFTVLPGGGGNVDAAGVPNGQITALLQATSLTPGFWIAPDGVTPLSSLGLILGFSTTNASFVGPGTGLLPPIVVSEIGCEGLLGGVGCGSITNTPPTDLFLSTNGQFRLAVPEPSSLMLLGGGLLLVGLFGFRRKKA